MVTTIPWQTGTGNITATYDGHGNGNISIQSDPNSLNITRTQQISIHTVDINPQQTVNVTITQAAQPISSPNFILADNKYFVLADGKYFNVQENN